MRLPLRQLALTTAFVYVGFVSIEAVAAEAPRWQPTAEPRDLVLNETELVGCYRVVSLVWTPPLQRTTHFQTLRLFELTSQGRIRTRGLSRYRLDNLAGWKVTSPTELTATWSSGFDGFGFVVRRRSTDKRFYGRVDTFTDVAGQESRNRGQVVFTQVRCPRPAR